MRGDERRLAGAVGTDERDEVVPSQHGGEVLHEHAARHFHAQILDRDHLIAAALGGLEVQRHRRGIARRRRETRQALESLALALRLEGVHAGDVPPDVLLFLLHVRALLLQLALAREPSLGALRHELAVVPLVRLARARFHVQDVRADRVEECTIVRHDDHRLVGVVEPLLKPGRGVEVEVVGRFVEEQQVGGRDELRREADAPALAARERRHESRLRLLGVEAESLEHRVDARVIDVAAEVGEALLVVPEPLEELVGDALAQLTQLDRLLGDALLERDDLAPRRCARLPDRGRALEGAVLVEQGVPESRLARDAPDGGLEVTGDELEDRRLAGAVAPDDAPPLTLGDGEGDVLEELGRAEGDADVGEGEEGHAEMGEDEEEGAREK